jgi:hypothetical protein
MKKNILFTFDYELFLGDRSGTIDNCLIYPTRKISEALKMYNAKGIFFIDTTYLIRLRQIDNPSAKSDYYQISEQIRALVSEGHYVFPHLHPHWMDAKYDPIYNQWSLEDLSKYRFHNISDLEKEFIFGSSVNILKEIIEPVDNSYQMNGYRAGGWSIQPYSDFKPFFHKYGIKYDFSVLPGAKLFSAAQYYDFSLTPAKFIYKFSEDITTEDVNGEMIEFVISKIKIGKINSFINKIYLKINSFENEKLGDGFSVKFDSENEKNIDDYKMIALELLTAVKLPLYLNYLAENDYVQFISHPKMISWHNLREFGILLKKVFELYSVETDFKKMI